LGTAVGGAVLHAVATNFAKKDEIEESACLGKINEKKVSDES
jgi:hypothetical protein